VEQTPLYQISSGASDDHVSRRVLLNRILQRDNTGLVNLVSDERKFDSVLQVRRQRNSRTKNDRDNTDFNRINESVLRERIACKSSAQLALQGAANLFEDSP